MKGLLKNNFYATLSGAKILAIVMVLSGAFIVAVISQSLLIGYIVLGIISFSGIAISVVRDEFSSKWGKYKLTLPVKRAQIVKSQFLNQLFWMAVGILFAITVTALSWLLHGSPFDIPFDIVTTFALGISMSLFMGAVFFPLFYLNGEEKGNIFFALSLLCAFLADYAIISLINYFIESGVRNLLLGILALLGCSTMAFILSYPLTVSIFKHKEY